MTPLHADTENCIPLCDAAEVDPGSPKRIEAAGMAPFAVFNLDGEFFARCGASPGSPVSCRTGSG